MDDLPRLIREFRRAEDGDRLWAFQSLVAKGATAVPYLCEALEDDYWHVRRMAAEALGRIGHPDALPGLLLRLRDREPDVRKATVKSLASIGTPAAVPGLCAALQDPRPEIRSTAAEALGRLAGPDAVPQLCWALVDGSPDVRAWAAWSLGRIGDPRAVPHLCIVLLGPSAHPAMAQALGDFRDPRAVWSLCHVLEFGGVVLRVTAEALRKIAERHSGRELRAALPLLQSLAGPWVRRWEPGNETYRAALRQIEAATAGAPCLPLPAASPAETGPYPLPADLPALAADTLPHPLNGEIQDHTVVLSL